MFGQDIVSCFSIVYWINIIGIINATEFDLILIKLGLILIKFGFIKL